MKPGLRVSVYLNLTHALNRSATTVGLFVFKKVINVLDKFFAMKFAIFGEKQKMQISKKTFENVLQEQMAFTS